MADFHFQPGQSGNPRGRPPGSKNKVVTEIFKIAKERGYRHPVVYMLEVMEDKNAPVERRDMCAIAAAPYMTPKFGTIQHRFVEEAIQIPDFASEQDAENFLADISKRAGAGELELQSALDISALVRNWILSRDSRREYELKPKASVTSSKLFISQAGCLRCPAQP